MVILLVVGYQPSQEINTPLTVMTVPPQEVFFQSTAFLLCVSSLYGFSTLLLILLAHLERNSPIGRELYRTRWQTEYHAAGGFLYLAAALWTTADALQINDYWFIGVAAIAVMAAVGHLTCGAFSFKSKQNVAKSSLCVTSSYPGGGLSP